MKEVNEEEWLKDFKDDLGKLEAIYEPEVPEHFQLMNRINQFKNKRKKAFMQELVVFLLTAVIILVSYAVIAFKMTAIFIWIQGFALFFIPIIFIAEKRRRKNRNEVVNL